METFDRKRLLIFLAFVFGIAWATALVIYLTGGLKDSPVIHAASGGTLALLLVTMVYMWAPTFAHVLTRTLTKEGWAGVSLGFKLRRNWRFWVITWFTPGILTLVGIAVYFLLFPQDFDPGLGQLVRMVEDSAKAQGQAAPVFNPWNLIILQTFQAMLVSPLINGLATFGEEFGWRSYLLQKLLPLGTRKALLLSGVIWGVWHAPVIAMGHNYGLDYAGFPWLGMLAMIWSCVAFGVFAGWATLRSGSVWPAVIAHAGLNGIGGLGVFMTRATSSPVLGPLVFGFISSIGFVLLAALILWKTKEEA